MPASCCQKTPISAAPSMCAPHESQPRERYLKNRKSSAQEKGRRGAPQPSDGAHRAEPERAVPGEHLEVEARVRLEEPAPQQLLPDAAEVGDVRRDDDLACEGSSDKGRGRRGGRRGGRCGEGSEGGISLGWISAGSRLDLGWISAPSLSPAAIVPIRYAGSILS